MPRLPPGATPLQALLFVACAAAAVVHAQLLPLQLPRQQSVERGRVCHPAITHAEKVLPVALHIHRKQRLCQSCPR